MTDTTAPNVDAPVWDDEMSLEALCNRYPSLARHIIALQGERDTWRQSSLNADSNLETEIAVLSDLKKILNEAGVTVGSKGNWSWTLE